MSTSPSGSSTSRESPRPARPGIAEVREVPLDEADSAEWISELSRMAIRLATRPGPGWPKSDWKGGEVPGLSTEAFYPID